MDFTPSPRVTEAVDKIRACFESDVYALEAELLARKSFKAILPELAAARTKVKTLGLWAPHLPAAWGGAEMSLTEHGRVSEERGKSPLGHYLFGCQAPDAGNMELLMHHGSAEQKERWLKPLAAGEIRSCFSMTEPDLPGSNPTWLGTTATTEGDDYVINGRKWFTTAAEG